MTTLQRFDVANIRARYDNEGYLHDDPIVARVGVLRYRNADGSERNELRLPDDVFDPASLETYSGKPITIGHAAMVDITNHQKHSVGTALSEGRQDGDNVRVKVIVQNKRAVDMARKGEASQLSVGYKIRADMRPGYFNEDTGEVAFDDERKDSKGDQEFIGKEWVRFHLVQRDIRVNHIAMVRRGRAGDVAKLNMDGDEDLDYDPVELTSLIKGAKMETVRLDNGIEYEVPPEVKVALGEQKAKISQESARADSLSTQVTTLTAQVDTLNTQVAGFDAKLIQARTDAAAELKARSELEASATKVGVTDFAGKSDMDVKKAVIGATTKINLDGRDDHYINAAFDMALAQDPLASQRRQINVDQSRKDSDESKPSASSARAAMISRSQNKGAK